MDRAEKAIDVYESLLRQYSYSHVRYEYAILLHEMNRAEEAAAQMRRLIDDGSNAPRFSRSRERRWVRRARIFLKLNA